MDIIPHRTDIYYAVFRLTREVRFAVNTNPGSFDRSNPRAERPTNSYGGYPSLTGVGHYYRLQVTMAGELDPLSNYLVNIKLIDGFAREAIVPLVQEHIYAGTFFGGAGIVQDIFRRLGDCPPNLRCDEVRLWLSPFLSVGVLASEYPMVRFSQKFEFSASHRLHNPDLDEQQNRRTFGKCNNPLGHGHNYIVQVTIAGEPDYSGVLMEIPAFERIVAETVIEPFDHRNLNEEVEPFKTLIPTVENIAKVIYHLLKPKFAERNAKLASVTVWETEKTWCEYVE